MIKENEIYSLIHYEYGVPYSGELGGMRYRIARNPLERVFGKKDKGEAFLEAIIWRGPFSFDTTQEEKITKLFDFSEEGRIALVEWLNEEYNKQPEYWKNGKISNILILGRDANF